MNTSLSAMLGIAFAVLGTASVFLMFHLWGYPFDKATRTSAAPKWLMILHRVIGFAFAGLYVAMMIQMVPRLWNYQVEFPPRTVAHIMLGITIGFLLLVKVSIIRFFRHLEEWMPFLGTGILLCTYLLIALSVPFAFRERALRARALGGDVTSPANIERLKRVLPEAQLPPEAKIDDLVTPGSLGEGRTVLLTKCVQCHDLKTVLTRPRSPKDWGQVVSRMSEKPVYGDSIEDRQQWAVTAYLVGISPDLQQSAKKARAQREGAKGARVAAVAAMEGPSEGSFDAAKAKPLFEKKCSECHELSDCDKHKWTDADDVKEVVERMVDNGLEASGDELDVMRRYLLVTYVKTGAPAPAPAPVPVPVPVPGVSASASASVSAPAPATAPAPKKPAVKPAIAASSEPSSGTGTGTGTGTAGGAGVEGETCGKKPLPDCPMQAWMKANAAGVAAGDDMPALAAVFDRIARMSPPGYGTWASISNDGANAARSGDAKGARAACASCHNAYRAKYKNEMRARPVR